MERGQFEKAMREAAESEPETVSPASEPDLKAAETPPPAKVEADPKSTDVPEREAETPPEPKGSKEWLAEKGVDIAELYDLKIPGTDITWSAAKDNAPDLQDVQRLKLETQKERDQLVTQTTETTQQMQAVLQALADKVGPEVLQGVVEQAPELVQQSQQAAKDEFLKWRPELQDESSWNQAHDSMLSVARLYAPQTTRAHVDVLDSGAKRMLLRLHQLESYLDTLREPAQPVKEVRPVASKDKPRGKRKKSRRLSSRGANAMLDEMNEALR